VCSSLPGRCDGGRRQAAGGQRVRGPRGRRRGCDQRLRRRRAPPRHGEDPHPGERAHPHLQLLLLAVPVLSEGLIWHLGGVFFPLQLGAAGQKQKMGLRQVVDRLMAASGPAGLVG